MNLNKKNVFTQNHIRKLLPIICLLMTVLLFSACNGDDDPSSSAPEPVDPTKFVSGTVLGGENIAGKDVTEAVEIGRNHIEEKLKDLEISVKFVDDTVLLKGTDFAYKEVLELTLPKLLESGQPGEYDVSYVLDLSAEGKKKIYEAAQNSYTKGANATVTGYDGETGEFAFSEGANGKRADVNKTLKNIKQLLFQKTGGALQAEFTESGAGLTAAKLKENFKLISSFSTVSNNTENGNHNMALSMSKVNGTVLEPGGIFSFNGIVGDSTTSETGFRIANGISGGVLVGMYGGGICQSSSTIYGAAIRAGMEIVMRECHSMESTYVPTGLDATVDYGNLDFQFRNNMETPIYIKGWMDGTTVYCEIYGVQPEEWDHIEVNSYRVETYAALSSVTFREDQSLGKGEYFLKSPGNPGYASVASRTYYKNDQEVKTEDLPSSYYPATGKIYTYGPGTDTTKIDTTKTSGSVATPAPSATPAPTPSETPDTPNPETPTENPDTPAPPPEETEDPGTELSLAS